MNDHAVWLECVLEATFRLVDLYMVRSRRGFGLSSLSLCLTKGNTGTAPDAHSAGSDTPGVGSAPLLSRTVSDGAGVSTLLSYTTYQSHSAMKEGVFIDQDDIQAIGTGTMWSGGRLTHLTMRVVWGFATLVRLNRQLDGDGGGGGASGKCRSRASTGSSSAAGMSSGGGSVGSGGASSSRAL